MFLLVKVVNKYSEIRVVVSKVWRRPTIILKGLVAGCRDVEIVKEGLEVVFAEQRNVVVDVFVVKRHQVLRATVVL